MRSLVLAAALAFPLAALAQNPSPASPPPSASAPMVHTEKAVPPSHTIEVNYEGHLLKLTTEDLLNLPQTTLHVRNGHSNEDETYTGPLLSEVLNRVGLTPTDASHETILHGCLVATATDAYYVTYALAELEPAFSKGKVIVAVMRNGLPDPSGIQLVNDTDTRPARWIHGLSNLNVIVVNMHRGPAPASPTH